MAKPKTVASKASRGRHERLVRFQRRSETKAEGSDIPLRDMMMPESFYQRLDAGIRFAVRVLHAKGFETCQSCQGGADPERPDRGHAYAEPTVDLIAGSADARGFAAVAALQDYGLEVSTVAILWNVRNGLPYEKLWRITLRKMCEERADEIPMFIFGYRASLHTGAEAPAPLERRGERRRNNI